MPKPKDDGQTYYEVPKTTKTKKPKYSQINCPELCCNAPPKTKKKVKHRCSFSIEECVWRFDDWVPIKVCRCGRRKESR